MAACDSAVSWKRQPQKWKVENLYRLNSSFSEISVASFRNQAIFSSNREQVVIRKKEGFYGAPSYDFYFSEKGSDSSWKKPVSFNHNFNTDEHETSGTFARGGNVFYFARTKADNDNVMRVKLYKVEKKNGLWGEVRHFVFNNSPSSFAQPFVDAKEQLLFFASDMPGGLGGTDLYVCVNDAGIWSNPYNLGPVVNTSGNETYPYYSVENEKLYFSSDGHLGMGGQDLYEAEQIEGEWSKVTNLKCPINSSADDFGIHFRNSNEGFFSSNREGGKGKEDLYLFTTR
jgi:peptidoglycan-associated lipoprotein